VRKIEKAAVVGGSRGCRKQSYMLTARRYDVGLALTWFEAALLDINGLPDLPDERD